MNVADNFVFGFSHKDNLCFIIQYRLDFTFLFFKIVFVTKTCFVDIINIFRIGDYGFSDNKIYIYL